jgi:exopolyphosphatase / guanosine-5'-triphosphate,3'-diphosphate pyrophosphatase
MRREPAQPSPTTLAVVDMGSNSFRLELGRVEGDQIFRLDTWRETLRIGAAIDAKGRILAPARRAALGCLARFAERLRGLHPSAVRAVATNTFRVARNAAEFLRQAEAALGFPIDVISGHEEARLIYLGVAHVLPPSDAPRLCIDIGGGSTEFIIGNHDPEAMLSIDIGCVRLFERHLATDPPAPGEVAALRADVREHLGKVFGVLDPSTARRVIGVAGTVTTITALTLGLEVYDPRRIHHAAISAAGIHDTAERLVAMTIAERAALPVMAKGREDVIAAGGLVMDEICATFGFDGMSASESDILDGVLLGLSRRIAGQS